MKPRVLLAFVALSLAGCFNFTEDLETCHALGGCSRDGGSLGDSGVNDAGAGDAGSGDAGRMDAGPADAGGSDAGSRDGGWLANAPVFFTSSGWGWEFPFPAGPGLHSVAAVNDEEAWATGDDDSVMHYVDGGVTFLRLSPAPSPGGRGGFVVALRDGGVAIVDGPHLYVPNGAVWTRSNFPLEVATAEPGLNGEPWFGGRGSCGTARAAVVEGAGGMPNCASGADAGNSMVGLDPFGWAVDSAGNAIRREPDGGWAIVARSLSGDFSRGDLLALSADDVLVVGLGAASSVVLSLDGGRAPAAFDAMGQPSDWTSLVRAPDRQGFFVAGRPGVYRCQIAVPLVVSQCALELIDESGTLEALTVGPTTLFGVGDHGQLIRREQDAGWSTLFPGGVGPVNDVFADPNGDLWAVAHRGWLLHATAAGWERVKVSTRNLYSVTRTSDGLLWVSGDELLGSYTPGSTSLSPATLVSSDGGFLDLAGSGVALNSLSGTEPGNTWAGGGRTLLGYAGGGTWYDVPLPLQTDSIAEVWASDAGTAWAVGGYASRLIMFWDGARWQNRTPPGSGEFYSVWGPSGTEAFVSGELSTGYHFFPDGGVTVWNRPLAIALSGAVTDAGFVVFGGGGTQVWRAPNGLGPATFETRAPRGGYITSLRILGSKIFVTGSRDENQSFVLSLDAGL